MNRVLVLVSGYLPGFKSGGPIRTVENMIRALGDEISFRVVCLDRDLGDSHPYEGINFDIWNKQGKADVLYLKSGIFCLPKLVSILRNGDFDVIHLNSCLSFQFSILPLILLRLFQNKTSIIIGPRGEFSKGAFSLKIRKKRLFIFLAKSIGLYDNVIWHASSAYEADDIRRGTNTAQGS